MLVMNWEFDTNLSKQTQIVVKSSVWMRWFRRVVVGHLISNLNNYGGRLTGFPLPGLAMYFCTFNDGTVLYWTVYAGLQLQPAEHARVSEGGGQQQRGLAQQTAEPVQHQPQLQPQHGRGVGCPLPTQYQAHQTPPQYSAVTHLYFCLMKLMFGASGRRMMKSKLMPMLQTMRITWRRTERWRKASALSGFMLDVRNNTNFRQASPEPTFGRQFMSITVIFCLKSWQLFNFAAKYTVWQFCWSGKIWALIKSGKWVEGMIGSDRYALVVLLTLFSVKPQDVAGFSCVSENWANLNCTWEEPANPLPTTYTLIFKGPGRRSP